MSCGRTWPRSSCRSACKRTGPRWRWAELFASGQADQFKEHELLHDFLTEIFCGLLGYARVVDNSERYTFSREKYVEVDGKYGDRRLSARQRTLSGGHRGQGSQRSPGPPVRRPPHVRGRPGVPLRHQPALRLDHVTSMRETAAEDRKS